jgi:hypothetical protein
MAESSESALSKVESVEQDIDFKGLITARTRFLVQ